MLGIREEQRVAIVNELGIVAGFGNGCNMCGST